MNNFNLITQDFNAGLITPLQFVEMWGEELRIHNITFDSTLQGKINTILIEANKKMSGVVKEINECQGWLTNIDF